MVQSRYWSQKWHVDPQIITNYDPKTAENSYFFMHYMYVSRMYHMYSMYSMSLSRRRVPGRAPFLEPFLVSDFDDLIARPF